MRADARWVALVVAWLIGSIAMLAWFERGAASDTAVLAEIAEHGRIDGLRVAAIAADPHPSDTAITATVIYRRESRCACNLHADAHIASLAAQAARTGVRFAIDAEHVPAAFAGWPRAQVSETRTAMRAPRALILDRSGAIVFSGPLSSDPLCGRERGLLEPVLRALAADRPLAPGAFLVTACRC